MEFSSTSYFKIIPLDDSLDKLEPRQINIVLNGIRYSNSDRFYNVYVEKDLIDKHGVEMIAEIVKAEMNDIIEYSFYVKEDTKCQIWKH